MTPSVLSITPPVPLNPWLRVHSGLGWIVAAVGLFLLGIPTAIMGLMLTAQTQGLSIPASPSPDNPDVQAMISLVLYFMGGVLAVSCVPYFIGQTLCLALPRNVGQRGTLLLSVWCGVLSVILFVIGGIIIAQVIVADEATQTNGFGALRMIRMLQMALSLTANLLFVTALKALAQTLADRSIGDRWSAFLPVMVVMYVVSYAFESSELAPLVLVVTYGMIVWFGVLVRATQRGVYNTFGPGRFETVAQSQPAP